MFLVNLRKNLMKYIRKVLYEFFLTSRGALVKGSSTSDMIIFKLKPIPTLDMLGIKEIENLLVATTLI